ncbi:unnamed protein product, partial [Owenia fusiformis]
NKISGSEFESGINICSWNANGLGTSIPYLSKLMQSNDIILLQEHWLHQHSKHILENVNQDFYCECFESSPDLCPLNKGHMIGHGGIAIMVNRSLQAVVSKVNLKIKYK